MNSKFIFILTLLCLSLCSNGQEQTPSPKEPIPFLNSSDSSVGYKLKIKFPGNTLSGLFYVKKNEAQGIHTVFISELGMTLFEAVSNADSIHVIYAMEALKSEKVLNIFKKQTRMLLHTFPFTTKSKMCKKRTIIYYKFASDNFCCKTDQKGRILSSKNCKGFSKIKVKYTYENQVYPKKIYLKQSFTGIRWNLELLN